MLLVTAMLVVLAPATARGSFPGENGVIAYTGEISKFEPHGSGFFREATGTAIWALEPKTGDQLQLTFGPHDAAPAFSPSGNMLAFQRYSDRRWTVFVARADGSQAKPLTSGTEPAFSPNGQKIVFVRPTGLFVTGLAPGSPVRQITHQRTDSDPRWSTRGVITFEATHEKRLKYVRVISSLLEIITPGRSRVHTLLTYTYDEYQLFGGFPADLSPDWSPDGRTVAVTLCAEVLSEIPFRLHTVPAVVLNHHPACRPRVWAPAGRRLAEAEVGELQLAQETTCPQAIVDAGTEASEYQSISWQPLHPGTQRIPTVPCEPRPVPPELSMASTSPSSTGNATTCIWFDHKKKCHQQR
jgi:WD40-like Beta Propeller Repeat